MTHHHIIEGLATLQPFCRRNLSRKGVGVVLLQETWELVVSMEMARHMSMTCDLHFIIAEYMYS